MAVPAITEIDLSRAPAAPPSDTQSFQLPMLYRVGADGKIWAWSIGFDGQNLIMCWETLSNFQQGLIQSTTRQVLLNSRSVSLYEQALQEARHEYKNKKDRQGYGEQLIQHDIFSLPAMLCTEWDPQKNQIHRWPVWVMAKLDGCRCRAHILPNPIEDLKLEDVHLVSRATQVINFLNGIRAEYVQFHKTMVEVIRERFPNISPICRVDGELYSHELNFDQISGITRLVRGASPVENKVKYFMFDLILGMDTTYDTRYLMLLEAYQRHTMKQGGARYLHILGASVANSKQDILTAHDYFVSQGFEGVIIRKVGGSTEKEQSESYYKGTRCTAIYKYKQFKDTEGFIAGAEAAIGGHVEGGIIWLVQDQYGRTFGVNPRGQVEVRKALYQQYLANPQQFLGQKYRYRYQDLTADGKPRFPIGLGFVYDR